MSGRMKKVANKQAGLPVTQHTQLKLLVPKPWCTLQNEAETPTSSIANMAERKK
jgi:hypothetical protein